MRHGDNPFIGPAASSLCDGSDFIHHVLSGQPLQRDHLTAQTVRRQPDTMGGQIVLDLAGDRRVLLLPDARCN